MEWGHHHRVGTEVFLSSCHRNVLASEPMGLYPCCLLRRYPSQQSPALALDRYSTLGTSVESAVGRKTEKEPLLPTRVFLGHSLCWNPLAEESEKQNFHVSSPCDSREHRKVAAAHGRPISCRNPIPMQQVEGLLFIDEMGSALQGSWLPYHTGTSCDPSVLGKQQQKLFPQLLQEDTCAL